MSPVDDGRLDVNIGIVDDVIENVIPIDDEGLEVNIGTVKDADDVTNNDEADEDIFLFFL